MADQQPFDRQAKRARNDEGHDHRDEEIDAEEPGQIALKQMLE